MKKITLFLLSIGFAVASCSSDNDHKGRFIKATIDGETYKFNTVVVSTEEYTEDDFTYTDVTLTGSMNSDPTKIIKIVAMQGAVGTDASWYFGVIENGVEFLKDDTFSTVISDSDAHYIKGTFSGQVISTEDGSVKTVTNGSFETTY